MALEGVRETCSLTRQACQSAATVKGIQTLDLSSNRLSKECATQLAKALWRCRSLHEIVLEESVEEKDAEEVKGGGRGRGWGTLAL